MPQLSLSVFSLDFKWFLSPFFFPLALTTDKYRGGSNQERYGDIVRCNGGGSTGVLRKLSGSVSGHRSDISTTCSWSAERRRMRGEEYLPLCMLQIDIR